MSKRTADKIFYVAITTMRVVLVLSMIYIGFYDIQTKDPAPQVEAGIEQLAKVAEYTPRVQLSSTMVKEVKAPQYYISDEEIELIALVTMAEAEGECEEGKRLVIDTILNRADTNYLGAESVSEVVYQSNQFTSVWNGRVDKCYVREDICDLVREELESRTNYDVIYFTAGDYGQYGTPMFNVGNHYFCSYD